VSPSISRSGSLTLLSGIACLIVLGVSAGICRGLSCGNHPIPWTAGSRHGFRCRGLRRVGAVKERSPPRSRRSLQPSSSCSWSSACPWLPRNSGATAVSPLDADHQHPSGLVALPSGPCPAGTPPDEQVYPWPFRVLFLGLAVAVLGVRPVRDPSWAAAPERFLSRRAARTWRQALAPRGGCEGKDTRCHSVPKRASVCRSGAGCEDRLAPFG
jgi:hypothetical protein